MQYITVLSAYPTSRQFRVRSFFRVFDDTLRRLFGCHHRALTRPFTRGKQTYIACLKCGMHREFSLETWTPQGGFFAEPIRARITVKPMRMRRVS
jgi:hypothetical protein